MEKLFQHIQCPPVLHFCDLNQFFTYLKQIKYSYPLKNKNQAKLGIKESIGHNYLDIGTSSTIFSRKISFRFLIFFLKEKFYSCSLQHRLSWHQACLCLDRLNVPVVHNLLQGIFPVFFNKNFNQNILKELLRMSGKFLEPALPKDQGHSLKFKFGLPL